MFWPWKIVLLIVLILIVLPIFSVTYMPLHDYPGHIARINILAHASEWQKYYSIESFMLPNIGMDVITLALSTFMPILTAGQCFVSLLLLLTASGLLYLQYILHRSWSWWCLIPLLFLYNWVLLFGFINYLTGVALFLWAVAFWIQLQNWALIVRFGFGIIFCVILFYAHLSSVMLFAIFVAGYELQQSFMSWWHHTERRFLNLVMGAAVFVPIVLLFMVSPTSGAAEGKWVYNQPYFWYKFGILRTAFFADWFLDLLLLAFCALLLILWWMRGKLTIAQPMLLPIGLLIVAFLITPARMFNGYYADSRLVPPLLYLVLSSVRLQLPSGAWLRIIVATTLAIFGVRIAYITYRWHQYEVQQSAIVNSLMVLPPDSILYTATESTYISLGSANLELWQPPLDVVPAYATFHTRLFVPAIWAIPGQQPINVHPLFKPAYFLQSNNPIEIASFSTLVPRLLRSSPDDMSIYCIVFFPKEDFAGYDVRDHGHNFALIHVR